MRIGIVAAAKCEHGRMILSTLELDAAEFERGTGWAIKPEGACHGDLCVPLPDRRLPEVARRLNMPLLAETLSGPWCLGPAAAPEIFHDAAAPPLRLPAWDGGDFDLASLRGSKVLLVAWAPW